MRKEYTYILTIGNKVVKPVAVGWWSTEEQMVTTRCGMATAARAFRKTAGILVYEKEKDSDLWVLLLQPGCLTVNTSSPILP